MCESNFLTYLFMNLRGAFLFVKEEREEERRERERETLGQVNLNQEGD